MINHKTVCLNMIVRNESTVILRCLEPLRKIIDYWVIVDTGSNDGTQQLIQEFLQNISGELYERVWIDFAHNRNEALNLARNRADYIIFIDADDRFEIADSFMNAQLDLDYYYILLRGCGVTYHRILMINNHPGWVWQGVVHEYMTNESKVTGAILDGIVCEVSDSGGRRSFDPDKNLKDARLLEDELKNDPSNSRTVFYLGQSYRSAGKLEEALKYYKLRASMPSNMSEENFWSLYLMGCIQEELKKEPEQFIDSYCKAYLNISDRAEPLYRLAYYFNQIGNYILAYLLGKLALGISIPPFYAAIDYRVYDFGVAYELARSAYFLGYDKEARFLGDKLLMNSNLPDAYRETILSILLSA